MLGRFICPVARLGELAAFEREFGDRPLAVSALAAAAIRRKSSWRTSTTTSRRQPSITEPSAGGWSWT